MCGIFTLSQTYSNFHNTLSNSRRVVVSHATLLILYFYFIDVFKRARGLGPFLSIFITFAASSILHVSCKR